MTVATEAITKTLVPEGARLAITPRYLKHKYLSGESTVYAVMRSMCREYDGGYWNYYELSNGSFYMAPKADPVEKIKICCVNMYEGEVSYEVAGIITCLYVWCQLANDTEDDHFIELYHNLLDYCRQLPDEEYSAIRRAIN